MQNYFSTNIKFIREQKGLTQENLANIIGKDYSTVGKWENGTRSPIMEDVLRIADILNIPVEDLLTKDLRIKSDNENIKEYNFGNVKVTLSKDGKITDEDFTEINKFLLQQKMLNESKKDN